MPSAYPMQDKVAIIGVGRSPYGLIHRSEDDSHPIEEDLNVRC